MGLRLAERHGREEDICKGVHGGASQSLKPLLAAGGVKEGRGLRGTGGGLGGGGAVCRTEGETCKGIDGDASQSRSSQACGCRHKGGVLG